MASSPPSWDHRADRRVDQHRGQLSRTVGGRGADVSRVVDAAAQDYVKALVAWEVDAEVQARSKF